MLVRNAFPNDFRAVADKSKEWAELTIEQESIYHIMLEHFRNMCFIAEDRGEIIGYLLGSRSHSDPDVAFIQCILVSPRLRGNGVGRRLFNQYQTAIKSMGCKKIMALGETENRNCAAFYEAMGFRISDGNTLETDDVKALKNHGRPGKNAVIWTKEI